MQELQRRLLCDEKKGEVLHDIAGLSECTALGSSARCCCDYRQRVTSVFWCTKYVPSNLHLTGKGRALAALPSTLLYEAKTNREGRHIKENRIFKGSRICVAREERFNI